MIAITFEFDGVSPDTLVLFEGLPQALEGRSVVVDYRPVAGAGQGPWMDLLASTPAPGRWVCEQVLRRGAAEPLAALAAELGGEPGTLPAAGGPVPAFVWQGRRFSGDDALDRLTSALPAVSPPPA